MLFRLLRLLDVIPLFYFHRERKRGKLTICGNGSCYNHTALQAVHSTRNKSGNGFIKKDNVVTIGQFVERPPICVLLSPTCGWTAFLVVSQYHAGQPIVSKVHCLSKQWLLCATVDTLYLSVTFSWYTSWILTVITDWELSRFLSCHSTFLRAHCL